MRTASRVLGRGLALTVGVVLGFFVVFNAVSSDVSGFSDTAGAIVLVFVVYLLTGVVFGASGRRYGWKWSLWFALPGAVLVLTSLFDVGGEHPIYILGVLLAVAVGSVGGSWVGAAIARGAAG